MAMANTDMEEGLLPPPPGVVPNFINPPNRDAEKYGFAGSIMALTSILVISRTYTRWVILKANGWQDYVILLAWAVFMASWIAPLVLVPVEGVHGWHITKSQGSHYASLGSIGVLLSAPSFGMTKIAVVVQIGAIFCPGKTRLYWFLWGLGISQGVMWTIYLFGRMFGCTPRSKIWSPDIPGTCFVNASALMYATAGLSSVTDVVLFGIALQKTWHLQMRPQKKSLVSIAFAVGLLGCVCSGLRIRSSYRISRTDDTFYEYLDLLYAVMGEQACCLIVCCIPVLRLYGPPLHRFRIYLKSRLTMRLFRSDDNESKHNTAHLPMVVRSFQDSVVKSRSLQSEDNTIFAGVSEIPLYKVPTEESFPNRSARFDYEQFGSQKKQLPVSKSFEV